MKPQPIRAALVAVNAQYIHTGLGVRSIAAYVRAHSGFDPDVLEYTINHHEHDVLQGLYQCQAEVYLFSCYLWNIEMILRLTRDLRQLRPDVRIGLGGPQVGYHGKTFLQSQIQVDFILTGEGEETVCRLLRALDEGKPLHECQGLVYREGEAIAETLPRPPLDMDALAFAYPDLEALRHRILYYESIRGCPFSCSYCTSSIERGVRKRSLPLVFEDLSIFLAHRVPQVKFVDRTFNCDKTRARAIWEWLAAHDNGVTNFHFELSGELLDEDTLAYLAGVRPGLFQFEIGVQSTHPQTLAEVDRPCDTAHLFAQVRRLLTSGNIHVHLDLIAGLPYEDFERFQSSFNDVYACGPHQLQLGFLKVLPGSKMERMAADYGLLYSQSGPCEVLANRWISYEALCALHGVARMVDTYYNSLRFTHVIRYLVAGFSDPFSFYFALSTHYESVAQGKPVGQTGQYDMLESFARQQGIEITEEMRWLAKYDLLLHEKPRKLPTWLPSGASRTFREPIQAFFMNRANIATYLPEYESEPSTRIERTAHLEVFPMHPETGAAGPVALLFNYRRRDVAGHAWVTALPVEALGFRHTENEKIML